jgi:hypothetical protein
MLKDDSMKTDRSPMKIILLLTMLGLCLQPLVAHEGKQGISIDGKGGFQDFPAMCINERGKTFVAYVDRPVGEGPQLVVAARQHGGELELLATVASEAMTAFDRPCLAPAGDGCLLVFSAEVKGTWKVGYLAITPGEPAGRPVFLELGGSVNIRPAVAASGDTFCLAWESNVNKQARLMVLTADWKMPATRTFYLTKEMETVTQEGEVDHLPDNGILYFRLDLPNDSDTLLELVEIKSE